jgi:hypothetical protein
MRATRTQSLICIALAHLATPAVGAACFKLPENTWHGYPADGATDVPLDVAPIYWGTSAPSVVPGLALPAMLPPDAGIPLPAQISLTSEHGENVALRPEPPLIMPIVPLQPLQPHTRYTLQVKRTTIGGLFESLSQDITIHFTTGDSLYRGDLTAPVAGISHYSAKHVSSCDPGQTAACINLPDDDFYDWRVQGKESGRLVRGSFYARMSSPDAEPFECLELRRRAPNGQLGPPAVVCRDDGPSYDLDPLMSRTDLLPGIGCEPVGLTWGGVPIAELPDEAAEPNEDQPEPEPELTEERDPTQREESGPASSTGSGCSMRGRDAEAPPAWPGLVVLALGWRRRSLRRFRAS